jgi:putative ABC transport system permease protein
MTGRRRRSGLPAVLFRWAFRAAPRAHREAVADEAAEAFEAGYRRRLEDEGPRAARRYLRRAVADAALAGWRLRRERARKVARGPRRTGSRPLTTGLRGDLRQALRRLRRAPGHAAAVVLILALGVGANTAVLSALRTAVAAPPPYETADRLVFPRLTVLRGAEEGMSVWSWPDFVDFRAGTADVFSHLAGYDARSASWNDPGAAESVPYELVTPGYFEALGAAPAAGRFFSPEEEGGEAAPGVVVLSHATWHRRFGGDPEVVGRSVTVDGIRLRVVGVAGPGLRGLTGDPAFWVPVGHAHAVYGAWMFETRDSHWFHAVAKLAPGVAIETAQARAEPIGRRILTGDRLEQGQRVEVSVVPFREVWTNPTTHASIGLIGAGAGLLLLIAIANVASLLLVRHRREARETAVRLALGAGRGRLLRARLVESLVIAVLAGVAGLALAAASVDGIRALWPERLLTGAGGGVRWIDPSAVTLDLPVMLAGLGLASLAALVFTLLPALFQRGATLLPALKLGAGALGTGGRTGGHGASGRSLLLGGQVAFSVALLVAAGLLTATLLRLHGEQRGFDARGLLAVGYTFAGRPAADSASSLEAAHQELLRRAERLPGVRSASLGTSPPLAGHTMRTRVSETIGGTVYPEDGRPPIGVHSADHGLFRTLGIRLLEGRGFTEAEDREARQVLVLSRLAARRLFPGESAVGRQIRMGFSVADWDPAEAAPPWTVIGVVDDVLYATPAEGLIAEAYVPYGAWRGQSFATLFVRAARGVDPAGLVPSLRREMDAVDRGVPFWRTQTGAELRSAGVADTRVLVLVLSCFAGLALLLAATGVWAVVAQAVAERRREIGLRVALGARAGQVEGLLVRQGIVPLLLGGATGLALAALGARALAGLLFETSVHEPAVFAGAAAVLAVVWLLASWLPARAARRVDPIEALSSD